MVQLISHTFIFFVRGHFEDGSVHSTRTVQSLEGVLVMKRFLGY